jgi:hypothetical protein
LGVIETVVMKESEFLTGKSKWIIYMLLKYGKWGKHTEYCLENLKNVHLEMKG